MRNSVGSSYSWNVICKVCGFKYKSHETRRRWDGLEPVCETCWEPRHPLDFYRVKDDTHKLPYISPESGTTPETGLGFSYQDTADPALVSTAAGNSTFLNVFRTLADCQPVALRFYHDGLYTHANGPVTLTVWTRLESEAHSSYTLRETKTVDLLPNIAGWVVVPMTIRATPIQFVLSGDEGDDPTMVMIGIRYGSGMTHIPVSTAGSAAAQNYLEYVTTYFSVLHNPIADYSTAGGVVPVDVVVKPV